MMTFFQVSQSEDGYIIEVQYETEDNQIITMNGELEIPEVKKLQESIRIERKINDYRAKNNEVIFRFPSSSKIVLDQINLELPENKRFYNYQDALIFYRNSYVNQVSVNQKLKKEMSVERKDFQKVNTNYKKIIKGLNKAISKLKGE